MSKVFTVAWREFKQTVLRPIFLIAVLGIPILIIGIGAVAILFMLDHEEPPLIGSIAIVESTGEILESAQTEFDPEKIKRDQDREDEQMRRQAVESLKNPMSGGSPMTTPGMMPTTAARGEVRITIEHQISNDDESIESLKQRIRDGTLLAVAIIDPSVLETPDIDADESLRLRLFVGEDMDSDHVSFIERRLGASVVRVRAKRAGLDPEQAMVMLKRPKSNTIRTLKAGGDAPESEVARELKQMIPFVFMMLIWIGVFTSAQHLMMTTIEEKSNRVMEVLLSALSPLQLMTGKILGHGGVGLLLVLIYSSVGIAALIAMAVFSQFIEIMDLVYLGVFYFMAYFMIAAIMAAVGSAVSDIREANTLVTPVMLLLMVPLMLWMPIIQDPNGTIATICSFVPPIIPFAMILRMAAEEPLPAWQVPISIIWGYLCVLIMIWGASKIFRVGVLMYGKPPNPIELIKWLRYS